MEDISLVRLERIARNFPVDKLAMHSCDGTHGQIYFAYGKVPDGKWMGIWGCQNMAEVRVYSEDSEIAGIRQALVDRADQTMCDMAERGLL